jgi:hypothetical protein
MFLTETWASSNVSDAFLSLNSKYAPIRCDREGRNGGGVAILIREGIRFLPLSVPSGAYAPCDLCAVDVYVKQGKIRTLCCYRPPGTSAAGTVELMRVISDLAKEVDYPTIIAGDFNLPSVDWPTLTGIPDDVKDQLLSAGLQQYVAVPTSTVNDNVLDLVFTNQVGLITAPVAFDPPFDSGHKCIRFTARRKPSRAPARPAYKDYRRARFDDIRVELKSCWSELIRPDLTLEDAYASFCDIVMSIVDKHTPIARPRLRSRGLPPRLRRLYATKKRLYRRQGNSPPLREAYTCHNRKLRRMVRQYFHDVESRAIASHDKRQFYNFLRRKLTEVGSTIPTLSMAGHPWASSALEKAECLADQFSAVFTDDDGSIPQFEKRTDANLTRFNVVPSDVLPLLLALPDKMTRTPDNLPPCVIRRLADLLCYPITLIFQRSVDSGEVPSPWRSAYVNPIFKSGDKSLPINYRPISLTSSVGKVLEKLVQKQIMDHLLANDLLSARQHGFLKHRSTATLLAETLQKWATQAAHRGSRVVMLDFAKAFDAVSHKKLAVKLQAYGISGYALSWILGFLSDRVHCVLVEGEMSSQRRVRSGVVQGSVVGPLLFSIFVNDLPECVGGDVQCDLFADDAKVHAPADSQFLQGSLDRIFEWSLKWQLPLAAHKCQLIDIGTKCHLPDLRIGATRLQSVHCVKDLGVHLTSDLSRDKHVDYVAKKARRLVNFILRGLRCRDITVYIKAFKSYVLPILEYATVAWNPFLVKHVNRIESVGRDFTRRALRRCGLPTTTYYERLRIFGLDTLESRRAKSDLKFFYRYLHGMAQMDLKRFYSASVVLTRPHNSKLRPVFRDSLNCIKHSFVHRTIRLWNLLPSDIVHASSYSDFCTKILSFNVYSIFQSRIRI